MESSQIATERTECSYIQYVAPHPERGEDFSAGRSKVVLADETARVIAAILMRYDTYGRYIKYPGDWGERAVEGGVSTSCFTQLIKSTSR